MPSLCVFFRNNVRLIANGSGNTNRLNIKYVAHSADIEVGDLLVSSGLGEVHPAGYPVGVVSDIIRDESCPLCSSQRHLSCTLR